MNTDNQSEVVAKVFTYTSNVKVELAVEFMVPSVVVVILEVYKYYIINVVDKEPEIDLLEFIIQEMKIKKEDINVLAQLSDR